MRSFTALNGKKVLQPAGEELFDMDKVMPIMEVNDKRLPLDVIFAEMDKTISSLEEMVFD